MGLFYTYMNTILISIAHKKFELEIQDGIKVHGRRISQMLFSTSDLTL